MKFDENEIRKAISIMKPQNSLFEIRVIAAGGGNASGYFRDADTCINAMRGIRMDGNSNVYIPGSREIVLCAMQNLTHLIQISIVLIG